MPLIEIIACIVGASIYSAGMVMLVLCVTRMTKGDDL